MDCIKKAKVMKRILWDKPLPFKYQGISPKVKDGVPVVTPDGPMMEISCFIEPTEPGRVVEGVKVSVPASGVPKQMQPYCLLRFEQLTVGAWGNSAGAGLWFSAVSVKVVETSATS